MLFPKEYFKGIMINSFEDFSKVARHPYKSCAYFSDFISIYSIPDNDFMVENFINEMGKDTLFYHINLDDRELFDINGNRIPCILEFI